MITTTLEGRLLTLVNRTSRTIGVVGKVLPPGGSCEVRLAVVQGNQKYATDELSGGGQTTKTYMDELNAYVSRGLISISIDGRPLFETEAAALDAPMGGDLQISREVWTNLAAADVNGIKVAFTAPAANTTYSGVQLDGAVGPGEMVPPRNIVITGTTGVGEALDGGTAVVTGVDADGTARTESFTLNAIGASSTDTVTGVIAFRRIVSVLMPADASGTKGDYEIGFGVKIGLARKMTQGALLNEFVDNAIPGTAATLVLAGTSVPNGTVQFNTAPDDVHDYIVVYIAD
jgi:hypothetical protein